MGFAAKSVYGIYSEFTANGLTVKNLAFNITDVDARESLFKKVTAWKCVKCVGTDDSHCQKAPVVGKSLYINFSPPPAGDASYMVNENSFPKNDANAVAVLPDALDPNYLPLLAANQKSGMTILNGMSPTITSNTGSFTFTAGKRPAAVGDAFEALADLQLGDKKYKAKLAGKVYQMPAVSAAPLVCAADEWLEPVYESP